MAFIQCQGRVARTLEEGEEEGVVSRRAVALSSLNCLPPSVLLVWPMSPRGHIDLLATRATAPTGGPRGDGRRQFMHRDLQDRRNTDRHSMPLLYNIQEGTMEINAMMG